MKIKIFDISNGKVVINEECLTIPELKAVVEKYENPIPALCYLYYMFDPSSSYSNNTFDEKEEAILKDYPGEYTTEDEVIIKASEKLQKLYITPTMRFYLDNKILLERVGKFARNSEISSGRDGNINSFQMQLKSLGKTIEEFKKLELIVQQELDEMNTRVRGGKKRAYDDVT